jgi:hypothetical protein
MKDNLQDLISHIYGLSDIDIIKIMGTDTETNFAAVSQDQNGKIVIEGSFKGANPEFIGTFGMPNLGKLKTILGFDEYDASSKIYTFRDQADNNVAKAFHFENKGGDFVNDYRLMAESIVKEKVSNVVFKGATWDLEFTPTVEGIIRLKKQAQANSEETTFKTKLENNELKIYFGDPATHSGNFVFQANCSGTLSRVFQWPVSLVIQVLGMVGDKTMRISDKGIIEIAIDSGVATYRYLIPAQSK